MSGWRAINTAPRDGSFVLLWVPGFPERARVQFGRWRDPDERARGPAAAGGQEWLFLGVAIELLPNVQPPSHWMPQPDGPSVLRDS